MDLKIKEEFKSLIPSLTAEEYEGLEKSIIQEGSLTALENMAKVVYSYPLWTSYIQSVKLQNI